MSSSYSRCIRNVLSWSAVFYLAAAFASEARAQSTSCPPYMLAVYHDPGLQMWFGGTATIDSVESNGNVIYSYRGVNLVNLMGVNGRFRALASQCTDLYITSSMNWPAQILSFDPRWHPHFRSLSQNEMCGPGGFYGGEGGEEEPTNRGVPGVHFDCVVLMGGGGGGGGGGSSYVTITTCHYSAYFDSNGNYSHSELEYCTEETFVMMT